MVYLDDILIFMETLEEHQKITSRVLELLEKHKLYLCSDKCEFKKTTIEYLGVIISHNSIAMDPVKITGVTKWPAPTNKKEVQSFLGFTNFYRRFIRDFSEHARLLFDLTRAHHGFANPRRYPGMGGTGTGMGRLKVTHRKPTPVARVWRVFPGTRITKCHMRHISLPPPTSIRPQTQQHAQDMSLNTTTQRWGGGEKDKGGNGPSCPSP